MTRAWLACALLTACAVAEESDTSAHAQVQLADFELQDEGLCDLLPTCGVCSKLCDPEALRDYVPPGVCAAFTCELTNGQQVSVHVCTPAE
jgi:hypothetical protein